MKKQLIGVLLLALIAACSEPAQILLEISDAPGTSKKDIVEDSANPPADRISPDSVVDISDLDISDDTDGDLVEELSCFPGGGCFLDPCDDGADCLSGLCVGHMGDTVCTISCVEECPAGWTCEQFGQGPDSMFACLSPYTNLCRPCTTNSDCLAATGVEDACLSFGADGSFCGAFCSPDEICPVGYSCQDILTVGGADLKQCVPDEGICDCSGNSIKLGLSTPCFVENDIGICQGKRTCTEGGLTDCDAFVPTPEICDGIDSNCDGVIDEDTCLDDNACTDDICDPESGCVNQPLTGTDCNDADVCSLADHCEEGACLGSPIDCDDGNPCTSDSCDPTGGCVYGFNSAPCDDDNPCTVNDTCKQGACLGFEVPCECQKNLDCIPLEDGDICTGTLFCDTAAFPHKCAINPATIITCPEPDGLGSECLQAVCHPLSGECSFEPHSEGKACDNGDACTIGEKCLDGDCLGATVLNCNDGDPCTDDSCNPDTGCVYTDNESSCNDNNVCTVSDHCLGGNCLPGTPLDCNDGNICTDDSCDMTTGCSHVANNLLCDDGNTCTTSDLCIQGQCTGSNPSDCDDLNICTTDWCDPLSGCKHDANSVPCDDGNACTGSDKCNAGNCQGGPFISCNDGELCTNDSCDPKEGCFYIHNENPCNDGNVCTTGDMCSAGKCIGAGSLNCNDGNLCTDDSCDVTEGCIHTANNLACNDGNPCSTGDTCQTGACTGTGNLECEDDNPCTIDSCDPEVGCTHEAADLPCNDGNICTTTDVCVNGNCVGSNALNCNDNNSCTDDSCDPESGCLHTPNNIDCNDGNDCTTTDKCSGGVCVGSGSATCNDDNICTTDWCDPAQGCVFSLNTVPCNDNDACTTGDTCSNGTCTGGPPLNCGDSNVCTMDGCNPATGCTYTNNNAICDDLNACTIGDVCSNGLCQPGLSTDCDDQNYCTTDTCNPLIGCQHNNNTAPCDDANLCTISDQCEGGSCQPGSALNCNDGNVCTDDDCSAETGCTYTNNAATCSDNNVCTENDICAGGSCQPGAGITCNDADACSTDSCDAVQGCLYLPITPCCGNSQVEAGEECDDGNHNNGDGCESDCQLPAVCEWKNVTQLYCNGSCSWAGGSSCDKADADIYCKLKTCNCNAYAISFQTTTALAQGGFSCPGYGSNLGAMPEYCVNQNVWYQASSILANHGAGTVVHNVVCGP